MALTDEREQIRRLGALVALGQEASVIRGEDELLDRAGALARDAFGRDAVRLGLVQQGRLRFSFGDDVGAVPALTDEALTTLEPAEGRADTERSVLVLPLAVKGHAAGVLEVVRRHGGFRERDRWLLRSLASQLSIALENARLYRQLDGLFRQYMSPDVATALLADPAQAALGGAVADVTVLFADLRGFTPFSERSSPDQVVRMLNRYFGIAVPLILAEGGTVVQFVGDAVMALFNAPVRQADQAPVPSRGQHRPCARRQHRQRGVPQLHRHRRHHKPGCPSGDLGRRGSGGDQQRHLRAHSRRCIVEPLGPLQVKGKERPVDAFVLTGLREAAPTPQ